MTKQRTITIPACDQHGDIRQHLGQQATEERQEALLLAEQFIAGFEGDESQEGISDLLTSIRAAIGGNR
ncbi:TPA: hypothetical protein NIF76_002900 [Pseudomonas aeruginosa]|nr:hypothetical protein [Pseudomonas aeruginosa]